MAARDDVLRPGTPALYELIRHRGDERRPVDPLIIAWDASTLARRVRPATPLGEPLTAAALHLGGLNPAPGTARRSRAALYAEPARATRQLGQDWPDRPARSGWRLRCQPSPGSPRPARPTSTSREGPGTGRRPSIGRDAGSRNRTGGGGGKLHAAAHARGCLSGIRARIAAGRASARPAPYRRR